MSIQNFFRLSIVGILFGCLNVCRAADGAEPTEKSNRAAQWLSQVTPAQKRAVILAGTALGAVVGWQAVALPFVISFAGGYASEAFVLGNPELQNKVKEFMTQHISSGCTTQQFGWGLGDGATYYALRALTRGIFSWSLSSMPVSVGLMAGQVCGVIHADDRYRNMVMDRIKQGDVQEEVVPNDPRREVASYEEVAARASGAIMSWVILAGLVAKLG